MTPHNGPMTSYEGSASVAEPDRPPAPRVSYLVARLDRLLRLWLADVLAPFEVSLPEYTAMSILGRRAGLTNAQLARRTYVSPQAMQQITEGLIARGLILRVPDTGRGRVLPATLTPAGLDLLARCDEAVDGLEERMMRSIRPGPARRSSSRCSTASEDSGRRPKPVIDTSRPSQVACDNGRFGAPLR